ncbi:MAG: hybrid sensor histidine kinase/response regulator [Cocleimonas sp.]
MAGISLIQKERYLQSYRLTPLMMAANLITSPALVAVMWDVISHQTLLIWLAVIYISCFLTLVLFFKLRPLFKDLSTIPDIGMYTQLPFAFGIIWGAAGYLFFTPDSTTHIAFLVIFLFGMASGAINALSSLWSAYAALAIPMLLPLTYQLFNSSEAQSNYLGLIVVTFLMSMLGISLWTYYVISNSLSIRYENIGLLKDLEKEKELALKASKDKSKFLAAANHDLRQPIHAISLLSSALTQEVSTDKGKEILTRINSANEVLLELLNSLLEISRLDAKIITPDIKPIDIQQFIKDMVLEFQPFAQENGIELRSHTYQFWVKSDPVLLATIVRNLIQNAIRYTHQGKVLISCRQRKHKIHLQVWDTGKGIAEKDQEKIYAEFQQLHNPERDQNKGLGLGLAICKRTCKLLGIPLRLKSQLGKGSVFTLELEELTQQEAVKELHDLNEINPPINIADNINNAVFLIIDDNTDILHAMTTLLEGWGSKVICAEDIESVKEIAKNHHGKVDAIIADYRLRKNTTGVQAIDAFHQQVDYHAVAILITGDTAPERMREVSSHGLPVLNKPVNSAHLKSALGRLLRMRS